MGNCQGLLSKGYSNFEHLVPPNLVSNDINCHRVHSNYISSKLLKSSYDSFVIKISADVQNAYFHK